MRRSFIVKVVTFIAKICFKSFLRALEAIEIFATIVIIAIRLKLIVKLIYFNLVVNSFIKFEHFGCYFKSITIFTSIPLCSSYR